MKREKTIERGREALAEIDRGTVAGINRGRRVAYELRRAYLQTTIATLEGLIWAAGERRKEADREL